MTLTFPNVIGSIEVYMDVMRAICGETEGKSMIDLCCGFAPNTPKLGFSKRRYFDIIDRKLDHHEEQEFFTQMDVLKLDHLEDFTEPFDVAICSDGIEHLTIEDGWKLLDFMVHVSYKQVIFTPLDNIFGMAKFSDKDPEAHRSLWKPEMVPGMNAIVFPDYHKEWNGGAWWGWRGSGRTDSWGADEFERVKSILKTKTWAYGVHE